MQPGFFDLNDEPKTKLVGEIQEALTIVAPILPYVDITKDEARTLLQTLQKIT